MTLWKFCCGMYFSVSLAESAENKISRLFERAVARNFIETTALIIMIAIIAFGPAAYTAIAIT